MQLVGAHAAGAQEGGRHALRAPLRRLHHRAVALPRALREELDPAQTATSADGNHRVVAPRRTACLTATALAAAAATVSHAAIPTTAALLAALAAALTTALAAALAALAALAAACRGGACARGARATSRAPSRLMKSASPSTSTRIARGANGKPEHTAPSSPPPAPVPGPPPVAVAVAVAVAARTARACQSTAARASEAVPVVEHHCAHGGAQAQGADRRARHGLTHHVSSELGSVAQHEAMPRAPACRVQGQR